MESSQKIIAPQSLGGILNYVTTATEKHMNTQLSHNDCQLANIEARLVSANDIITSSEVDFAMFALEFGLNIPGIETGTFLRLVPFELRTDCDVNFDPEWFDIHVEAPEWTPVVIDPEFHHIPVV
jgi:hypothetical protein